MYDVDAWEQDKILCAIVVVEILVFRTLNYCLIRFEVQIFGRKIWFTTIIRFSLHKYNALLLNETLLGN